MHSRSVELCVVALRGNRGPGCATCSRSLLSVKGVILVEEYGHSHPPSPILVGGPRIYHFPTFYVRGRLSRGIYHFSTCWWGRLHVRLCFIDAELRSMSVLSMLSSLLRSANGRMTSAGQLAESSFVKIDVDSQDRIWLLLIPYRCLLQP